MPRQPITYSTTAVTASPADDTETVIATLPGVTVTYPSDRVVLTAIADISWQAAVTGCTLKIRRTGVSGTTVATMVQTPKAAADIVREPTPIAGVDTPGDMANGTYVLTCTLTAAGGASTVNAVSLIGNVCS